jgi:hypothetical protein
MCALLDTFLELAQLLSLYVVSAHFHLDLLTTGKADLLVKRDLLTKKVTTSVDTGRYMVALLQDKSDGNSPKFSVQL